MKYLSTFIRGCRLPPAVIVVCLVVSTGTAGPVTTFDDIEYWVGTGANQSALVLDWQGNSTLDNSLAWGYRFDGTPKAVDMVTAIVSADDRLYARMGQVSGFGMAVFGFGYDANNDGMFALQDDTAFDADGIAISEPTDGTESADPADLYIEGWFVAGFWHYGVATGNPYDGGTWARSGSGISSRDVLAESWHSLAFTPTFSNQAFAQNSLAAEPSGDADFDADGDVDGRDFLIWQRGFGLIATATPGDGDANGDGNVDATDLVLWQEQYGIASFSSFTSHALEGVTLVVPEPTSLGCFCLVVGAWSVCFSRIRLASRRMIS
jgi:hypothetical protein